MQKDMEKAASQNIITAENDFNSFFNEMVRFSRVLFSNQEVLASFENTEIKNTVKMQADNILAFSDCIDGVFIADKFGNYYKKIESDTFIIKADEFSNTEWYKRLNSGEKDFVCERCGEKNAVYCGKPNCNYIMTAHNITDNDTGERLACVVILIDTDKLGEYLFNKLPENFSLGVVNSRGDYIITPKDYDDKYDKYFDYSTGGAFVTIDNQSVALISGKTDIGDWMLVGMLPENEKSIFFEENAISIITIFIIDLIYIAFSILLITNYIFIPIKEVQDYVSEIEKGSFKTIPVDIERTDEISSLKVGLNHMVESIKSLMEKTVKEEKIIAQNELDLLQAQINPHFLYNTLDAVSALALLGDNDSCLEMTRSLGSFYRNMLHTKNRLVSVNDEIACIESYMTIINIRYENKIKTVYDIDDDVKNLKVLKMILQPIVENAVHHGLRSISENAVLTVRAYRNEDKLIFTVADNGVGIEKSKIPSILKGENRTYLSGFGLYSSIQRVSLFYGIEDPISIISEPGKGTEVVIRTKILTEGGGELEN